jgi:hypothetical protein
MSSKFRLDTCIGISLQALEELTRYVAELHGDKRRRKEKLQDMGAQSAILWERLRITEEEQMAFTKSVQCPGTNTYSAPRSIVELRLWLHDNREKVRGLVYSLGARKKERNCVSACVVKKR